MADNGGGATPPRDAWLRFKRVVRRFYILCGTIAILICTAAVLSRHLGWLDVGWNNPNMGVIAGASWSVLAWLALNSGEVIRVVSFGLLSWALFVAAMRMETIFNIVRGFNEARSPISQLQDSVQGIKGTLREVKNTFNDVKQSAHEFDKNMNVEMMIACIRNLPPESS